MFIELAGALRCPRIHDQSWLVLSADRIENRNVLEGLLGCPVCHAQFPIVNGTADLRLRPDQASGDATTRGASGAVDPDGALRLAAMLNLDGAGGYVVLMGEWARHASALLQLVDVHLMLINAPTDVVAAPGCSSLLADDRLPLVTGGTRGAAIDHAASPVLRADAVRLLKVKGRLVGPHSAPIPEGVTELARDAECWVAERGLSRELLASIGRRRG
ncbi:MAG TPA: hypothetical protein VFK16_09695 [Gemmatimonadaceae bacterium]|nr:hypothetical protein [Gemmatimonadaceae bacterium]